MIKIRFMSQLCAYSQCSTTGFSTGATISPVLGWTPAKMLLIFGAITIPQRILIVGSGLAGLCCATHPTVLHALWLCGSHRVLCVDSTDRGAVSRLLGERKPFLVVTDPPYGIELDSEWRDRAELRPADRTNSSYSKHGCVANSILRWLRCGFETSDGP